MLDDDEIAPEQLDLPFYALCETALSICEKYSIGAQSQKPDLAREADEDVA